MCEFCKQWKQMNDHNFNVQKFYFPGNVAKVANVDASDSDNSEVITHCPHEPCFRENCFQSSRYFQITS